MNLEYRKDQLIAEILGYIEYEMVEGENDQDAGIEYAKKMLAEYHGITDEDVFYVLVDEIEMSEWEALFESVAQQRN